MSNKDIIPQNFNIPQDVNYLPPTPEMMNTNPDSFQSPGFMEGLKHCASAAGKGYMRQLDFLDNIGNENVRLGVHQRIYDHKQIEMKA